VQAAAARGDGPRAMALLQEYHCAGGAKQLWMFDMLINMHARKRDLHAALAVRGLMRDLGVLPNTCAPGVTAAFGQPVLRPRWARAFVQPMHTQCILQSSHAARPPCMQVRVQLAAGGMRTLAAVRIQPAAGGSGNGGWRAVRDGSAGAAT
jgi:pentatricopeptide repeat protein